MRSVLIRTRARKLALVLISTERMILFFRVRTVLGLYPWNYWLGTGAVRVPGWLLDIPYVPYDAVPGDSFLIRTVRCTVWYLYNVSWYEVPANKITSDTSLSIVIIIDRVKLQVWSSTHGSHFIFHCVCCCWEFRLEASYFTILGHRTSGRSSKAVLLVG